MNYFLKFSLLFMILFSVQSCMEFDVDEELNNNEPITTEQYFTIDGKKFYIDSNGGENSLKLEHIPTGNEVEGAAVMIAGYDKTNPDIHGIITFIINYNPEKGISGTYLPSQPLEQNPEHGFYDPAFCAYAIGDSTLAEDPNGEASLLGIGSIQIEDKGENRYQVKLNMKYENGKTAVVDITEKFN